MKKNSFFSLFFSFSFLGLNMLSLWENTNIKKKSEERKKREMIQFKLNLFCGLFIVNRFVAKAHRNFFCTSIRFRIANPKGSESRKPSNWKTEVWGCSCCSWVQWWVDKSSISVQWSVGFETARRFAIVMPCTYKTLPC